MASKKQGRAKVQEESLAAQLAEMRGDLSDKDLNEILTSASSIGRVKSAGEYAQDREVSIKTLLQVPMLHPHSSQAQTISDDVTTSTRPTHTPENMPLLVHQFYCQRLQELAQLKHTLLVRWSRFAVGAPQVTEELQEQLKLRMEYLLHEYNHTLERSRILSKSVDAVLAGKATTTRDKTTPTRDKATPTSDVIEEDVLTYLRWLVYRQHVNKEVEGFIRSLQWYPMIYYDQFSLTLSASKPTEPEATKKLAFQKSPNKPTFSSLLRPPGFIGGFPKQRGVVSNQEEGVALPVLTTSVGDLQSLIQELSAHYSIEGDSTLRSQADELQLYHRANRRFRVVFLSQETSSTLHTYDRLPSNGLKRQQKSKLTFRKPSNWVEFVTIRARPDPVHIMSYAAIRQTVCAVDEFLSLSSHCTHLHSLPRVLYALRQHYVFVMATPPHLTPPTLPGPTTSHDSSLLWKCIYSGVDSRNPLSCEDTADDSTSDMGVADDDHTHSSGGGFNVSAAMKLIHNTGSRAVSAKAHHAPKDAYFAFLMLRHLKIREERQKCLNVLNYFRSVERTLTINEEGLTVDGSHSDQKSSRTTRGLDHRHLFNTPADYIVDQAEFMTYMEVENHDDFYSFEASNQIRVWDQQGVGVVYDSALEDLSNLETELLTVGSYYLSKGPQHARSSNPHHHDNTAQDLDVGRYAQVSVDRFTLLCDLWAWEAQYLLAKMKVMNCYLECYHHTVDRQERGRLAEVITTLLWSRPRYDHNAQYFADCYEAEVQCLGLYSELLSEMVCGLLDKERAYNQTVCGRESGASPMDGSGSATPPPYGMPRPLIAKQLVSLTGDRHLLIHSYLLETAVCLGTMGGLHQAIDWSLAETTKTHGVTCVKDTLTLHTQLLEAIINDWRERPDIGSAYSPELQTHLFTDTFVEDPKVIADLCVTHGNRAAKEAELNGAPPKEQVIKRLLGWTQVVQLVVTRHSLTLFCSDSQILAQLYKQQLADLDQEPYHAHLRYLPFDLSLRLPADKNLDYFVTKIRENSGGGERCGGGALKLAVKELDEKHVGVFSFRSREGINKVLSSARSLDAITVTTSCQLAHRHALLVACQHNHIILSHVAPGVGVATSSSLLGSVTSSEVILPSPVDQSEISSALVRKLKKTFVSIQTEKSPVRDYMLAQFTKQPSTSTHSHTDLLSTKATLIYQFSSNLTHTISVISLRVQLVHHFDDLHHLLNQFPAIKSSFFTLGKPRDIGSGVNRSGSASASRKVSLQRIQEMGGVLDPRQIKARPPLLLDKEGEKLMNLWYLPHFTEVLEMFSVLPLDKARRALERSLCLVSALHMLLQYMCAYVRLGHTHPQGVGGGWGGIEGIGSYLLQLQSEISQLSNPTSPDEVGRYLWLRCRVAHLTHDLTVRHQLRKSLLHNEQQKATQLLDSVSVPSLRSLHPPYSSHLPHPLHTLPTSHTYILFPRAYFDSTHHPLAITSDHTHRIGSFVYGSLAVFEREELNLAHGELLAVSLHLEDVLKTSDLSMVSQGHSSHTPLSRSTHLTVDTAQQHMPYHHSTTSSIISQTSSAHSHRRLSISHPPHTVTPPPLPSLTLHTLPLESAELLVKFLKVSYQLERLKVEWGSKVLGLKAIKNKNELMVVEDAYRNRVYNWARKWVAKQQMRELSRMQIETDSIDTSSTVTFMTETTATDHTSSQQLDDSDTLSELALEQAQVMHLCELLDSALIQDTMKHLSKQQHLQLSERERDHTSLPLDLWRNTALNTKEITGLSRSHVLEDFVRLLESKMTDTGGDTVSLCKSDVKECVQLLATGVLAREKDSYHLYASYYEALLRSQYHQLYLKNQEIDHYRCEAESSAKQSREETLNVMADHTHQLLLELTALRSKVKELNLELAAAINHTHSQAQLEYSQLVDNLYSATMAIKSRYEEYRGRLYGDMTRSLYEVRQSVAESVKKMKEKLEVHGGDVTIATGGAVADDIAMVTRLKAEGVKNIQQENAELSKLMIKMRAVHAWNSYKEGVAHKHKVASLQGQLNTSRTTGLEQRLRTEQEITSLKQQLLVAQKSLGRLEREGEAVKHHLEEEKRKKYPSVKQTSKAQESSFRVRGERSKVAKLEQLKQELDVKEKLLRTTAEEKKVAIKQVTAVKVRSSKVTRDLKHHLRHERHLKSDAFHQVDELLAQVEEYTQQESAMVRSSLQAFSHTPLVSSTPATSSPRPTKGSTRRPNTVSGQSTGGETIDLSQEILALRLI